jgi:ABC-2 type transport system ATP-binding protein
MRGKPISLLAKLAEPNPKPTDAIDDNAIVIVENLYKNYGDLYAVDGISFEVKRGEIFGLLGPNGAGKTTTVEIIEGLRQSDNGLVQVCGFNPATQTQELKQHIGVSMQLTALPDRLKVREALHLFASFYRWRVNVDELLQLVSLEEKAESFFHTLSGGQQQRLAIGLAIVNDPTIVILDEPTAGLDPQARLNVLELIKTLREQGRTIIFTTHYMEDAEKLCDRVAIIDEGKIIDIDSPQHLIAHSHKSSRIAFNTATPLTPALLRQIPFSEGLEINSEGYVLQTTNSPHTIMELIKWLETEKQELVDLHVKRPSLEDVFIELTGRRLRE